MYLIAAACRLTQHPAIMLLTAMQRCHNAMSPRCCCSMLLLLTQIAAAGYPGDKASGTMWQSTCGGVNLAYAGSGPFTSVAQCSSGGCGNIMSHTCLSYDGQSGSAMWDSDHLQRAILCGKVCPAGPCKWDPNTALGCSTGLRAGVAAKQRGCTRSSAAVAAASGPQSAWHVQGLTPGDVCGMLSRPMGLQVQTDGDVDYNVGTLVDAFVYNTIAQWYNEDMSNETMPLSPVAGAGRASKPSPFSTMTLTTPWVLAVLGVGAGLLVMGLVSLMCTFCCRGSRPRSQVCEHGQASSREGGSTKG